MSGNQITVNPSTGQISFSNIRTAFNNACNSSDQLTAISITAMRRVSLNKTDDGGGLMVPLSGSIIIGRGNFTNTVTTKGKSGTTTTSYNGKTFVSAGGGGGGCG
jgi:hypothetical protein